MHLQCNRSHWCWYPGTVSIVIMVPCSRLKKDFQPFACAAARQPLPLAKREGGLAPSEHRTGPACLSADHVIAVCSSLV